MQFEEKLYDKVIQALFKAMDDVNQLLPKKEQLEKSEETVLSGESGKLDSLGLVNLIVAAERKIEEDFGLHVPLTNEKVMLQSENPFKTVRTLATYIAFLLE